MKQSLFQWHSNPAQGTMPSNNPFTEADECYLIETLTECRVKLESALRTAHRYHQLPDLVTAIADSLTAIHKAEAITIDPITYLDCEEL